MRQIIHGTGSSIARLLRFVFWYAVIVGTAIHVLPLLGLLLEDRYEAMNSSTKFLSVMGFLVVVAAWHIVSRRDRQREARRSPR